MNQFKNILRLSILLFSFIPFSSFAFLPPDSIGFRKTDGKNFLIHRIDSAEGWYSIARLYKISYAELRMANKDSADKLVPGRTLLIPYTKLKADDPYFDKNFIQAPAEIFHTVKEGETLFSIAKRYNTNVDSLKRWNNLAKGSLQYGRKLKVGYTNAGSNTGSVKEETPDPKVPSEVTGKAKEESKTAGKNEARNKKDVSPADSEGLKADKKKVETVEVKPGKIIPSAERDSTPPVKNNSDAADKGRKVKSSDVKADSTKLDKKAIPVQTKIIKTASGQLGDSAKNVKSASAAKSDSKKGGVAQGTAKPRREITENGVAAWIQDDDINPNKYYALHRSAPIGTIIRVTNKMNKKYVFVKVVGTLPDTGDNNDLVIKISKASAEKLGVRDSRFQSELSYGITEK